MTATELQCEIGTLAIRKLRLDKLKNGFPFMINLKEIGSNHCYLEYPDNTIKFVFFDKTNREFNVIHELTELESNELRNRLGFETFS